MEVGGWRVGSGEWGSGEWGRREGEGEDFVAVPFDLFHLRGFEDAAAHRGGVVQEHLVVDRAVHLEGGSATLVHELSRSGFIAEEVALEEVGVPEFLGGAPLEGRADLDGKAGGLDLVPYAHLVEDRGNGGQVALADVVAGEGFALDDDDVESGVVLFEERADGAARRPSADDGDVTLHATSLA